MKRKEQKFFCATALSTQNRGKKWKRNQKRQRIRKHLAFQRAAQGSGGAPTLWGRLAALLSRLTQSLFDPTVVRLMCYVDDPLAALRGSHEERQLNAAIMVLTWSALGFKLAFPQSPARHVSNLDWWHTHSRKGRC